ncbi:PREDICTED: uncharacterized protein LOC109476263 isoform X1 [Branchiostoma belcheri]|uniref:Uncharacterized protein LOC109476263 isoform X1 n=1 Tax=Branchiostoma belcheri TaxID=7741 RepID=A0A6P4YTF2_BRABE|nr:PREDICTED: uncharacterized protein LOC109476263 isoform X1 [Branchiostoma belcheri]
MATWRKPLTSNVRQPATVGYRAQPMKKVKSLGLNIPRDVPNLLEQIYTSKQSRQREQKVGTVLIHRVGESSSDSFTPLEYTASFEASHPAYTCLLPTTTETNEDLVQPSDVPQDPTSTSQLTPDNDKVTQGDQQDGQNSEEDQGDEDVKDDAVGQDTVSDTGESLSAVSLDVRSSEEDTTFPSSISLSPDKYDPVGPEEIILHDKADALRLESVADAFLTSTQKAAAEVRKPSGKSREDVYALVSGEGKHVQVDSTASPVKKTPSRRGPPPPRPPRSNSQKRVHFATVATVDEQVSRDNTKEEPRLESPRQAQDQQKTAGGLERSASNVSYIDITGIRKDSRPLIFV